MVGVFLIMIWNEFLVEFLSIIDRVGNVLGCGKYVGWNYKFMW